MAEPFVMILMGSDSDLPIMQGTFEVLDQLGVVHQARVASAHRSPEWTQECVKDAESGGCRVFICAAGMAAHLAGVVAGLTTWPVIGVPVDSGPLQGTDALLSTAMMPAGIPVATVAIGSAGARNAGFLAAQILAIADHQLAGRIAEQRRQAAQAVRDKSARLQEKLG